MGARTRTSLIASAALGLVCGLLVLLAWSAGWEGLALGMTAGLAAGGAALSGATLLARSGRTATTSAADDLVRRLDLLAVRQVETRDELRADVTALGALLEGRETPGGR